MKRFLPAAAVAAAVAAASEAAHAEVRTYVCVFADGQVTPGVSGVDWRRIDRIIVDTDDATIRMNDSQAKRGIEEEILGGIKSYRPMMDVVDDTIYATNFYKGGAMNFFIGKSETVIVQVDNTPQMTWARYRCASVP